MDNVKLIDSDIEYPLLPPEAILNIIGTKLKSMTLFDITKNNKIKVYDDKYIIINTKVISGRDTNIKNLWHDSVKNRLFDLLNEYQYKIILIGEKNYSDCYEYKLHGTFSIYEDIINSNLNNLIDLTTVDTISLYEEDAIIRNLNYLSKSIFNIHIGDGGGIRIFAYVNNMIALTTSPVLLVEYMNTNKFVEYSFNSDEFINKVKIKLENYV
jgi:hypothetical protein